jgi:hypothetical protein
VATISILPKHAHNTTMTLKLINNHIATRGAGDTGVSCKDKAAGKNCASWALSLCCQFDGAPTMPQQKFVYSEHINLTMLVNGF